MKENIGIKVFFKMHDRNEGVRTISYIKNNSFLCDAWCTNKYRVRTITGNTVSSRAISDHCSGACGPMLLEELIKVLYLMSLFIYYHRWKPNNSANWYNSIWLMSVACMSRPITTDFGCRILGNNLNFSLWVDAILNEL